MARLSHVEQLRIQTEREQQEQAARDRRNRQIAGIVVIIALVVALCLAGFFTWRSRQQKASRPASLSQARELVEKVSDKPGNANRTYGFTLSKNGINKPISGVPTVEIYSDFMCPACGIFERATGQYWKAALDAGQVNLDLHPNAFLDMNSTDRYSTRSASAIVYVAQHDPKHLFSALEALYDESYQPQEASDYKPVSNARIADQLVKGGVPRSVADAAVKGTYTKWVGAVANYTVLRKDLQHPSGEFKGQMTTPTLLINHRFVDLSSVSTGSYVQVVSRALGLPVQDAGNAGVKASIGATGAPKLS